MKTKTIPAAFAAITALTLCSCTKTSGDGVKETLPEGQAELKLNISTSSATKVYDRSDAFDTAIDSIAILVFNDLSELENLYVGGVNQGKVDAAIKTSIGVKTVMAFANGSTQFRDSLRRITRLSDIENLKSDLNTDNTPTRFLMKGRKDNVNINSASFNLDMEVARIVARVEIHKITNAITPSTDKWAADRPFMVNSIYLLNSVGEYSFAASPATPEKWYNMLECDSSDQELMGDLVFDKDLVPGESYTTPHYFYTYPNNCTNFSCTDATWCPRPTRLAIECTIGTVGEEDERIYYYSFNVPDGKNPDIQHLSANTTYSITSCTITRRGSETPYGDIPVGSASINITVKDWETGESYEYTI